MVHILLVSEMIPQAPCGVVTYYKKLMALFSNQPNIRLTLVTIDDATYLDKKVAYLLKRVLQLGAFLDKRLEMVADDWYYRRLFRSALRRFKASDFHLIHAQEPRTGYFVKQILGHQVPLALTCHFNDTPVEEDMLAYQVQKTSIKNYLIRKYRKQLSVVDQVIFVSRYCLQQTQYLLSPDSEVFTIHNGVDFASFTKGVHENGNQSRLEIINTGHIEPRKNQKLLVAIAQDLLKQGFSNFHISILGTGPDLPALQALISQHQFDPYFSLPGWVTDVNAYLDRADLYIHTSSNDNCPYSVIESIARKTPVLGFKVGGLSEILEEKYLFELGDYHSMAQFVMTHYQRLHLIAEEQYETIMHEFSIQHQFNQVKDIYFSSKPQQLSQAVGAVLN